MNWLFPKKPKTSSSDKKGKALKASASSDKTLDGKDKPFRGNYLCGRCNMPKKGHQCPFDVAYRPVVPTQKFDGWVQVELGEQVLSKLGDLSKQGTYESYIISDSNQLPNVGVDVEVAKIVSGSGTNGEDLGEPRISEISIGSL